MSPHFSLDSPLCCLCGWDRMHRQCVALHRQLEDLSSGGSGVWRQPGLSPLHCVARPGVADVHQQHCTPVVSVYHKQLVVVTVVYQEADFVHCQPSS